MVCLTGTGTASLRRRSGSVTRHATELSSALRSARIAIASASSASALCRNRSHLGVLRVRPGNGRRCRLQLRWVLDDQFGIATEQPASTASSAARPLLQPTARWRRDATRRRTHSTPSEWPARYPRSGRLASAPTCASTSVALASTSSTGPIAKPPSIPSRCRSR